MKKADRSTDQTVSITFTGNEYREVLDKAESSGVSLPEYVKKVLREHLDAEHAYNDAPTKRLL